MPGGSQFCRRNPTKRFLCLSDLSRDKSGRACLPMAGAIMRPPKVARPDYQPKAPVAPPLPYALRLQAIGPINCPLASRSDGPQRATCAVGGLRSGTTGARRLFGIARLTVGHRWAGSLRQLRALFFHPGQFGSLGMQVDGHGSGHGFGHIRKTTRRAWMGIGRSRHWRAVHEFGPGHDRIGKGIASRQIAL